MGQPCYCHSWGNKMPMPQQRQQRSMSKLCVWEINKNNTPFAMSSTTTNKQLCLTLCFFLTRQCVITFTDTLSLFHKCWYSLCNKTTQVIMITIQENSLTASDFSSVKLLIQCMTHHKKCFTLSLEENGVTSSSYIITVKSIWRHTYLPIYEHTFIQFLYKGKVSIHISDLFTHVSFYVFQTI
jgi:hypothetical protein